MLFRSLCLSPEAVAAAGAPAAAAPAASPAARVNSLVERAIQRHGSAENALSVLMAQNVTLEDQSLADRQTITDLRGKVPDPEKMVVLPKERADLFNKFEALKLSPEDITKGLAERDTLKGTVHTHGVEKLSREGAPAIGFDPDATAGLIASKALHVELREIEVEVDKAGKKEKVKQKVPFVRPSADEKAQLQPLTEYAKTLPAFEQRALQAVATTTTTATPGTPYPESRPTPQGDGKSDVVSTVKANLEKKYPLPSELRRQSQLPATQGA